MAALEGPAAEDQGSRVDQPLLLEDELFVLRSRAHRAGIRAVRMQAIVGALPVVLLAAAILVAVLLTFVDPA
jgi:hypothetical protein